jgi:hypothetical protein
MYKQEILSAFHEEEKRKAHKLLATRVAYMMGRKFEEGDWADIYCKARGIPLKGWSNLDIDIMNGNQGIEQKMLRCRSGISILDACGQTFMHPSATRSIRIPSLNIDPNEAMRIILAQYADLIYARTIKVLEQSNGAKEADMRTGWLLWQDSLREFLYFEERMIIPNPDDYYGEWVERNSGGIRKQSKNLWIYEKDSGKKRYSVTTEAGAKIQPYFDVPSPKDPNLYHFIVIGEVILDDTVRIWITESTYMNLCTVIGDDLSPQFLSQLVLEASHNLKGTDFAQNYDYEKAKELLISKEAYQLLQEALPGVNDDHSIRLLIEYIKQTKS